LIFLQASQYLCDWPIFNQYLCRHAKYVNKYPTILYIGLIRGYTAQRPCNCVKSMSTATSFGAGYFSPSSESPKMVFPQISHFSLYKQVFFANWAFRDAIHHFSSDTFNLTTYSEFGIVFYSNSPLFCRHTQFGQKYNVHYLNQEPIYTRTYHFNNVVLTVKSYEVWYGNCNNYTAKQKLLHHKAVRNCSK
jgi:hypothetical protein